MRVLVVVGVGLWLSGCGGVSVSEQADSGAHGAFEAGSVNEGHDVGPVEAGGGERPEVSEGGAPGRDAMSGSDAGDDGPVGPVQCVPPAGDELEWITACANGCTVCGYIPADSDPADPVNTTPRIKATCLDLGSDGGIRTTCVASCAACPAQ